jgi:hypothetical protein
VSKYDKDEWEETISESLTPDDWFDGDADKLNAKSKYTLRSIDEVKYDTYDIWYLLLIDFVPENIEHSLSSGLIESNFTEDDINERYDTEYKAWEIIYSEWDFTSEDFDDESDDDDEALPILKDPEDYEEILDDFNEWSINMNKTLQPYNLTIPNVSKEEFFWSLLKNALCIAYPIDDYLEELVDVLEINDAKVKENSIEFENNGNDDYTTTITFNDQGIRTSLTIQNDNNKVIYEIKSDKTTEIVLIIVGVSSIIGLVGVIYLAIQKRKKIREI